jgi:hypothetical protein
MIWYTQNRDAIIAGIVSSAIVLTLQVATRVVSLLIYDIIVRRLPTKRIWGIASPKQIYVVSGSIETLTGPTGLAYLAAPDAEAVAVVSVTLRLLYPKAELVHAYSPNFSPDLYGAHVVSVGGPINNTCTRTLMKALGVPLRFEQLDLVTPKRRYELKAPTAQDPVNTDYGLVISAPNPFTPGARCLIIAGCDTHGVLAAANALSPDRLQRKYRHAVAKGHGLLHYFKRYRYYSVVSAQALANTVGPPKVEEVVRL